MNQYIYEASHPFHNGDPSPLNITPSLSLAQTTLSVSIFDLIFLVLTFLLLFPRLLWLRRVYGHWHPFVN